MRRFIGDLEAFRRFLLHPVGQLKAADASLKLRLVMVLLLVPRIHFLKEIQCAIYCWWLCSAFAIEV